MKLTYSSFFSRTLPAFAYLSALLFLASCDKDDCDAPPETPTMEKRLVRSWGEYRFSSNPEEIRKIKSDYQYTGTGNILRVTDYIEHPIDGDFQLWKTLDFHYDNEKRLKRIEAYSSPGFNGSLEQELATSLEYKSDTEIEMIEHFFFNLKSYELDTVKITLNDQGRTEAWEMRVYTNYNFEDVWLYNGTSTYEFSYDALNRPVEVKTQYQSNDPILSRYTFDDKRSLAQGWFSGQAFEDFANQAILYMNFEPMGINNVTSIKQTSTQTENTQIEFEYDADGYPTERTETKNGTFVSKQYFEYGFVDVSSKN
ncbi:hypothetical protein FUAX_09400 [Fulvitalea axinellae]|uniref:YD repeat-containing protein n=1 Tax=Fulvitalea axinellae TaxID=1182444 RepID=A0AAU9CKI1_9BACT|nr:hypothetical protein FUAX_09400 [Fulvitalea axinellae]